jgi:regulator of sigma E protease
VINVLPFPALDGGRLLFIIIEAIMRKPIPAKIANGFNLGGFALLMLLMLAVTYHDIFR